MFFPRQFLIITTSKGEPPRDLFSTNANISCSLSTRHRSKCCPVYPRQRRKRKSSVLSCISSTTDKTQILNSPRDPQSVPVEPPPATWKRGLVLQQVVLDRQTAFRAQTRRTPSTDAAPEFAARTFGRHLEQHFSERIFHEFCPLVQSSRSRRS